KKAGIEVELGLLNQESDGMNKHFYYFIKHQIPYVTLKMATSLDGKYATVSGASKWITSEASRQDVHVERSKYQAILVGINTVMSDDPTLNVRLNDYNHKQPLRIILDTHGNITLTKKVVTDDLQTLVVTSYMTEEKKIQLEKHHVGVLFCQSNEGKIDLKDMLFKLGKKGIQSIFIEGGKTIHESFLRCQLVNEVITYVAPKIIGGTKSIQHLDIFDMKDTYTLNHVTHQLIGDDIKIKGELTSCLQES
ncbi:MAG: bifunctional diaminohydroxyphosphoribosylaminopyrimidine deaminase/5-amino-6-(5-phosphoribosylamino)uracil reductase RibD, partial [Acholeplasmataceae bacterium]